jgi:hypothetical protein
MVIEGKWQRRTCNSYKYTNPELNDFSFSNLYCTFSLGASLDEGKKYVNHT